MRRPPPPPQDVGRRRKARQGRKRSRPWGDPPDTRVGHAALPAVPGGTEAQQLRAVPLPARHPGLPPGRRFPRLPRRSVLRLPRRAAPAARRPLRERGDRGRWAGGPGWKMLSHGRCGTSLPAGALAPLPLRLPRRDGGEVVSCPGAVRSGERSGAAAPCPHHPSLCSSSFCPNLSAISTILKLSHNVAVSLAACGWECGAMGGRGVTETRRGGTLLDARSPWCHLPGLRQRGPGRLQCCGGILRPTHGWASSRGCLW